jgi:hypothetical protein
METKCLIDRLVLSAHFSSISTKTTGLPQINSKLDHFSGGIH